MNAAHYDAVVIGSGFGGSLVAHALVQAGLKTALLERGQWAKRDDADWDQRAILLQKRYRTASPLLVKQYGRRTFQRTYPNEVVGGNSVFYGGASLRLRPADFARWPLSYADLAPYYARAEQLLEVHGEAGTDPYQPPGIDAYPRRAIELSAPAQRIYQAGTALGFQPFKIPLAINFSDRTRPLCLRCITCDGFPCKVEAKNDVASTLLAAASAAGLEIIVGAVAQRLVQRGGRVEKVEYVDSASRQTHALSADLVVLAAGALNSPALMLRSGFDHPLIGRFLMRHCNGIANCIFPFRTNPQQVFHKQLCIFRFLRRPARGIGHGRGRHPRHLHAGSPHHPAPRPLGLQDPRRAADWLYAEPALHCRGRSAPRKPRVVGQRAGHLRHGTGAGRARL